jgi:predicted MPP superfamily phosphohydrolase
MNNTIQSRRNFLKIGLFAGSAILTGIYTVFIERSIVQINKYRIPIPRLPPAFEHFTIVHLTDLHYGLLVSLSHLQSLFAKVNSIPRDMIVCTGDYIHERYSSKQIDTIWPELAKLHAPDGVLSVLGNHDHWADTDRSIYWLNRIGQNMRNRIRKIERNGQSLWFAGAGDLWEDKEMCIDELLAPIPQNECRIVLAHNPDSADTIIHTNADLVISGHTHGGQVRIPFIGALVLPVKNTNYSSGLKYSKDNTPVFISRGIGWAMYPVRCNCFPEIAVLELVQG